MRRRCENKCFGHWDFGYLVLFRISDFDLPAQANLTIISLYQPMGSNRAKWQLYVIGQWQAGIRILSSLSLTISVAPFRGLPHTTSSTGGADYS